MSDPKLISPLLDGFTMGAPISDHDGVLCCPAIKENSENKYIVKIISIPASQKQMDALLLAGAYRDPADAMEYYRQLGEDVMKEAQLLKDLSDQNGFVSYEGWQMEPITKRRLGYEVYLISRYKRSLEKHVKKEPVTHLQAMNLGLDLCAALSACRDAGALYVDLKPSNVFISAQKQYSIGDLGFVMLDAMNYTVLPDKYRSAYTPPEVKDPMSSLNLTVDTYAVGMLLYQLYNDGQLPSLDNGPEGSIPSPINADYELAEIILKSIHTDPEQRWQNPAEMRQALVAYIQRNTVNDIPITPHTPLDVEVEPVEEAEEPPILQTETADPAEHPPSDKPAIAVPLTPEDETVPGEEDADALQPHEMSDELSRMLSKAEDLISHETPEGVVLPDIPDPPDPFAFATEDEVDDSDVPVEPEMEEQPQTGKKKKRGEKKYISPKYKKRAKKAAATLITLLILCGIGYGGYWFYGNVYKQTINDLSVSGDRSRLVVTVDTQTDNSLLTVSCADNYGNVMTQPVTDGQAVFTGLLANTLYRIQVQIDGFHSLDGKTTEIYTTETTTSIISFNAVTGPENGSVLLTFTTDGKEPEEWIIHCQTSGEEDRNQTFTGHSVTISGLSVGKVYTFTLEADEDLSISGATSLDYMASRLILAQGLTITSNGSDDLTVRWNSPGDVVVDSWSVRCVNSIGYEQQLTVHDTEAYFSGIDLTDSYTIEVIAEGMTQPARTTISANPVNITALNVDESDPTVLGLSWEHTGNNPTGEWILTYTIDGSASEDVIRCKNTSAQISTRIPGAKYQFTIRATDDTSVFNSVHTYSCPEGAAYDSNNLHADDVSIQTVLRPEGSWNYETLAKENITSNFASGDLISIVLNATKDFYTPGAQIKVLYVLRDAHGNILPSFVAEQNITWLSIWDANYHTSGELDLPITPTDAGEYHLSIYVDGCKIGETSFTISE